MFAAERFLALIAAVGLTALTVALVAVRTSVLPAVALVAVVAVALWQPRRAVLVLAGLAPMGAALRLVVSPQVEWTDLLLLAAIATWLARIAAGRTHATDRWLTLAVSGLCATALASALALFVATVLAPMPAALDAGTWWRALAGQLDRWGSPLRLALRLSAGAGTALWIASEVRATSDRRAATGLLLASVSGLALLSIYRLAEIALRTPDPLMRAIEAARTLRLVTVITDPNALGALFLLLTPVAFDWSLVRGRRAAGMLALVVLLAGAWLAGSRTTMAATPLALIGVLALRTSAGTRRRAIAGTALILVCAAALLAFYPRTGGHGQSAAAWTIRRDMGTVTLRMLRDAPVGGVGIGQFHRRSTEYMPPTLRRYYEAENAHNQYLQIAGELGLVGLAWFVAVLVLAVVPAIRRPPEPETAGLLAGVVAFLVASIAQHPLLDSQVAAAFWIALGLLRAPNVQWPAGPSRGGTAVLAAIAAIIVLTTPITAATRIAEVDLSGTVTGASHTRREAVGPASFRSTSSSATLYLPGRATRCHVSLRARGVKGATDVALTIDGRPAGSVTAVRGEWRDTIVPLASPPRWPYRHHRLDLEWQVAQSKGRRSLDIGVPRCEE